MVVVLVVVIIVVIVVVAAAAAVAANEAGKADACGKRFYYSAIYLFISN